MNRIKSVIAILILQVFTIGLFGQVTVEKSDKQILILGKKYFLHEVKKGQTIYSICRAYDVNEHELIAENAGLVEGLKTGMEIKIPVKDSVNETYKNNKEPFIYHTVEKKQTLYFLSNKYNVSESELIRLNPEISNGLKVGQLLKIPKPGTSEYDTDTGYRLHTIQPGETLFSLAQKYGIEISSLKMENPELQDQGPRIGQTIKIPIVNKSFEDILKVTHENSSASASLNYDPLYFEEAGITPCNEFRYSSNIKFKVAVFLPFFIQENNLSKNSGKYYKNSARFFEFYQGLLLSAKKMKETGVSVEFYIRDTKANSTRMREILSEDVFKEMDLIIGPVYSENFKITSLFAKENKINIVAPFKQKYEDLVVDNPFIFLSNPSDETEIANISKYIAHSYDRSIILVHNGTEEELKIAEIFKKKLVSSFASYENINEIVFKQLNYKAEGASALEDALSVGLGNIVIIPSTDVVFITNLATKLNYLTHKYKLTVFGMRPWEQIESVETDYLQNLKFHYGTTSYVDQNDEKVKVFDYQYKVYYKDESSLYSYMGYDIGYFFLNVLKDYGKNFQFCLSPHANKPYKNGLRFDFNFERISPFSGFENNWLRIVKVNEDLQTIEVK